MALLYDLAGRPQDLAELTTDMCNGAADSPDGELDFFARKNKANRTVYLSKRTIALYLKYRQDNHLNPGEKLFDKPNKNIQKNLRKYIYKHIDQPL